MLAFINTIHDKEYAVKLAKFHQEMDSYRRSFGYWMPFAQKGCGVGCMTKHYCSEKWHEAVEPLYGIPESIAWLQDYIFEHLPETDSKEWTVRLFEAIPEGSDLSEVADKLILWMVDISTNERIKRWVFIGDKRKATYAASSVISAGGITVSELADKLIELIKATAPVEQPRRELEMAY